MKRTVAKQQCGIQLTQPDHNLLLSQQHAFRRQAQQQLQNAIRRQQRSEHCSARTRARMLSRREQSDILREIHSHCETTSNLSQDTAPQPAEVQMQAEQHFSVENLQLLNKQLSKVNNRFDETTGNLEPHWQFTEGVSGGDRGVEHQRFRRPSASPATSADGHQPGSQHQRHRSQPNTAASQPQRRHVRPEFVVPLTDPRAHGPAEAAQRQDTHRGSDGERLSARLTGAMMLARARRQLNPGRQTPHHVTNSRSPSVGPRLSQQATFLAAIENMEALERAVEGVPYPEEQSRHGRHSSLNLSGSDHRSPASSSRRSTSQQFVQPQQHETPPYTETPTSQPVTDSVTLTYQCSDASEQTKMLQYINGTAAKCIRTSVENSPGIKELPQVEAKAVRRTVGDNETSLEIILRVFGDENIVIYIFNCVQTLRTRAEALIPGEDDEYSSKTLINHIADFLLSTLDTLFTEIIAKPRPNSHIKSCSISQLSPGAMVVAEELYPNFIPLWSVVPSTLSEALTSSQALLSTTGKVYMFGDLRHLMHQHRNMMKMTTEAPLTGCYVEELMSFSFGESDTSPLDPTARPASASGGSDRDGNNADLKSQKHSESSYSEQPSPIMTINIDMLGFRPGYANVEDRRKIRASQVLEDTANEVAYLF